MDNMKTLEQAQEIRKLYYQGVQSKHIYKKYNITKNVFWGIIYYKTHTF